MSNHLQDLACQASRQEKGLGPHWSLAFACMGKYRRRHTVSILLTLAFCIHVPYPSWSACGLGLMFSHFAHLKACSNVHTTGHNVHV